MMIFISVTDDFYQLSEVRQHENRMHEKTCEWHWSAYHFLSKGTIDRLSEVA